MLAYVLEISQLYNQLKQQELNKEMDNQEIRNRYDSDSYEFSFGGPQMVLFSQQHENFFNRRFSSFSQSESSQLDQYLDFGSRMTTFSQYLRLAKLDKKNEKVSSTRNKKSKSKIILKLRKSPEMRLAYSKAIIQFSTQLTALLPISRKMQKTKKKNQYNQSFFSFLDKKMRTKKLSKNYDGQLQKKFNKMTPEEQQKNDLTVDAIRCLAANIEDPEANKILKGFQTKYEKEKRRADLLDLFARLA